MTGEVWVGQLERAVRGRVDDVEITPLDRGTMTFALHHNGVVVHLAGDGKALVSPSLGGGGAIDSEHLEDRVQYLSLSTYEVDGSTVLAVADLIAEHLTGEKPRRGIRTLRDGYGPPDLTTDAGQRRERFLALLYAGTPFAEHAIRYRNDDPTEINFSKEMGEAISFGHLAVANGLDHLVANIENREPPEPDLFVTLVDESHLWVEVGQVTEPSSAQYFAAIQKVNQHLRRLENADSAYLAEIQGRHVSVQLPEAPPASKSRQAAGEVVSLFRSITFDTVQRMTPLSVDSSVTPYLASLNAYYYVGNGLSTYVRADNVGNSFNPDDSADDLQTMLASKMSKTYAVDAPLWLVLPLTDLMHVPMLSLAAIRRRVVAETGQFNRILVGTLEDALLIEAAP